MNSKDWYTQTFHRNGKRGRNRYKKGYRHHQGEPFGPEKDTTELSNLPPPPKNTILADKFKELGLIK